MTIRRFRQRIDHGDVIGSPVGEFVLYSDIAGLLEFAERVAKQKPEKPDYWSSCSQCERNASDAEDLVDAIEPKRPAPAHPEGNSNG